MAENALNPDLTQDSTQPSSIFTKESTFADSAISVGSSTPRLMHADDGLELESASSECSQPTLSERLNYLAASAFALEEDCLLDNGKGEKIRPAMRALENALADAVVEPESGVLEEKSGSIEEQSDGLDEIQLHEIHASLAATVASMRERQQEQRHLHQLALQKMEAVAQTCIIQRKQVEDLNLEVRSLRAENQKLGEENDHLRQYADELATEATQKEAVVHAMSGAVSGLEGWMNSPVADRQRAQSVSPRRGKIVVRGKGRFRGRYFVDDPEGEVVLDTQDTTELHDGVKSWLKGFRDVEEELHRASPPRVIRTQLTKSELMGPEDDWGDFQTVSEV